MRPVRRSLALAALLAAAASSQAQETLLDRPVITRGNLADLARPNLSPGVEPVSPEVFLPRVTDLPIRGQVRARNLAAERRVENAFLATRARVGSLPDFATTLRAAPVEDAAERRLASVLRLRAPPDAETWRRLAAQGVRLEGFVGGTTYLASVAPQIDPATLSEIVDGARVLRPRDKLRAGLGASLRRIATTPSPPAATETFLIEASSVLAATELVRAVSERGARAAREVLPGLYAIDAAPQRLGAIAELSSVLSIDLGPPRFAPLADGARDAARIDPLHGFRLDADLPVLDGLSGRGVSIAIFDTAIDEGVRDFCDLGGDPTVDRFFRRESDMSVCDTDIYAGGVGDPLGAPHGTHVAGIAAGTGRNSSLPGNPLLTPPPPFTFRGVAPEARLGEFVQVKSRSVALEAFRLALHEDGADVSNHSYVESLGPYGTWSGFLDALVSGRRPQAISETGTTASEGGEVDAPTDIPRRPQVWAAGNSGVRAGFGEYGNRAGYYSVYTQAKNTISVGAYDIDHGRVSELSSLGPTFDGRIKPDLVAPGCYDSRDPVNLGLRGPRPGTQLYLRLCGTSMAAPVVSGTIALMRQAAGRDLLPSSYKAALIATATDLVAAEAAPPGWTDNPQTGDATRYGAGPDFASGFGLLDASGAVAVVSEPGHLHEGVLGPDDEGESAIFCTRLEGDKPVAAALAWDDVPGAQLDFNAAALVNDLDLELRAPDGTQHLPWTLEAPETAESLEQIIANGVDILPPERIRAAVPGRDSVNTVERVDLDAPAPGLWRLVVSAPRLGAGPQDFSLVLTNVIEDCPVPE